MIDNIKIDHKKNIMIRKILRENFGNHCKDAKWTIN